MEELQDGGPASVRISRAPDRRGACLLTSETWLPRGRAEVFAFFSDAYNLRLLTPPALRFEVMTTPPIGMRAGTRIDYRLRVRYLPIHWRSEITVWQPPELFVDQQHRGPYRYWRHEHHFEEARGGTLARDRVVYDAPCGWLTNRTLVGSDLRKIFAYRRRRLREIFGAAGSTPGCLAGPRCGGEASLV